MDKAEKQEIMRKYGRSSNDCGSSDVQVALLTKRINELTEHCKAHPQDVHSRRGLENLVNKRRKHLQYLQRTAYDRYQQLRKDLNLRA